MIISKTDPGTKFFHRACRYQAGHVEAEWATSGGWHEFNLVAFLNVHRYQPFNFSLDPSDAEDEPMQTRVSIGVNLGYIRISFNFCTGKLDEY